MATGELIYAVQRFHESGTVCCGCGPRSTKAATDEHLNLSDAPPMCFYEV